MKDFGAEYENHRGNTFLAPDDAERDYRRDSVAVFGHTVHGFAGHRDTFALLEDLPKLAPELPLEFFYNLRSYLDHADYLSLRFSCREWSNAISYVSPPAIPTVRYVPAEVLQQVYSYLRPVDFNAARHTCRGWMLASLELHLLTTMLRRGGWGDVIVETLTHGSLNVGDEAVSQEWKLSKLLARECSLGPDWTGVGVRSSGFSFGTQTSLDYDAAQDPSLTASSQARHMVGLKATTRIDFSDLSSGYGGDKQEGAAVHLTVSACGEYILVAEGCMIYIYKLGGESTTPAGGDSATTSLTAITSIVCPRRVLAVSMDTSSQRFAVAALLDGRMGLVCDLEKRFQTGRHSSVVGTVRRRSEGFHFAVPPSSSRSSPSRAFVSSSGSCGEREITEPALGGHDQSDPSLTGSSQSYHDPQVYYRASESAPDDDSEEFVPGAFTRERGVDIENGPRNIYRNLCSEDDPPRSVAICPQRRCVAFGCSAGIELHWVDALSGQDLNRWFPLTAPSDFLYFLPPRKGVDSAKKLRLISSAAHPNDKPAMHHHFYPPQTISHVTWGHLRHTSHSAGVQASSDCDHYRAVPLSDGSHVLFTDPATGMLCIGNDAPIGGPTKLFRKIMMVGPEECVPSVYAAGSDLRWGVRVVAGYGDRVYLFSIPPDVFRDSKLEPTNETLWQENSWRDYIDAAEAEDGDERALWPARIRGAEIGRVSSLVDLTVNSSPNFAIWAFGANGEGLVWEIDDGSFASMRTITIRPDGVVEAATDPDGDVIMCDAPSPEEDSQSRPVSFDGTSSVSHPLRTTGEVDRRFKSAEAVLDADGDVVMTDAYADDDEPEFALTGGSFAIMVPCQDARWSDEDADWVPDYLQGEALDDGILALLGVVGLDCEIL